MDDLTNELSCSVCGNNVDPYRNGGMYLFCSENVILNIERIGGNTKMSKDTLQSGRSSELNCDVKTCEERDYCHKCGMKNMWVHCIVCKVPRLFEYDCRCPCHSYKADRTKDSILKIPEKEFETIRVLMAEALSESNKCKCLSCKGLQVLAKRIVDYNKGGKDT